MVKECPPLLPYGPTWSGLGWVILGRPNEQSWAQPCLAPLRFQSAAVSSSEYRRSSATRSSLEWLWLPSLGGFLSSRPTLFLRTFFFQSVVLGSFSSSSPRNATEQFHPYWKTGEFGKANQEEDYGPVRVPLNLT